MTDKSRTLPKHSNIWGASFYLCYEEVKVYLFFLETTTAAPARATTPTISAIPPTPVSGVVSLSEPLLSVAGFELSGVVELAGLELSGVVELAGLDELEDDDELSGVEELSGFELEGVELEDEEDELAGLELEEEDDDDELAGAEVNVILAPLKGP